MLTVCLQGGLGNQLFQYAYAYARQKEGAIVELNISKLLKSTKGVTKRFLTIDNFKISINLFSEKSVYKNILIFINTRLGYDLAVRFSLLFANKKNGLVDGYFSSEKYFIKYRDDLLREFDLKEKSEKFLKIASEIKENKNPCMIHARRGDYLKQGKKPLLNILDEEYYLKALEYIPYDSVVYLFSDDINWLENIIKKTGRNYISISSMGFTDYEELILMSKGTYFIIPNSTFAWWGAWLSTSVDKKVIAPKKWFNYKKWHRANIDIYPDSWIRI